MRNNEGQDEAWVGPRVGCIALMSAGRGTSCGVWLRRAVVQGQGPQTVWFCGARTGEEPLRKGPTRPPWVVDRIAAHAQSNPPSIQDIPTAQSRRCLPFSFARSHCYPQLVRHDPLRLRALVFRIYPFTCAGATIHVLSTLPPPSQHHTAP